MSYLSSEFNSADGQTQLRNNYELDKDIAQNDKFHEKEKVTFRVIMLCILASMYFAPDLSELSADTC